MRFIFTDPDCLYEPLEPLVKKLTYPTKRFQVKLHIKNIIWLFQRHWSRSCWQLGSNSVRDCSKWNWGEESGQTRIPSVAWTCNGESHKLFLRNSKCFPRIHKCQLTFTGCVLCYCLKKHLLKHFFKTFVKTLFF